MSVLPRVVSPGVPDEDRSVRRHGTLLVAASLLFALVCGAAQVLRADLDPWRVPLSAYLVGPYSAAVQAVYALLAFALVRTAYVGRRGSRLVAVLFAVAGAALLVVSSSYASALVGPRTQLIELVHGLAAQTTFLCLTVGMLVHSARWPRRGRALLLSLAIAAFLALWSYVLALWPALPRGAQQKLVIVLILAWLVVAGRCLRRGAVSS